MTNEPENRNENLEEGKTPESKPKKKNLIRVFRPQNSKTGMLKPEQRPGTQKRRPAAEAPKDGRRSAPKDPARRPGAAKPAEAAAPKSESLSPEQILQEAARDAAAAPKSTAPAAPAAENAVAKAAKEAEQSAKSAEAAKEAAAAPKAEAEKAQAPAGKPAAKAQPETPKESAPAEKPAAKETAQSAKESAPAAKEAAPAKAEEPAKTTQAQPAAEDRKPAAQGARRDGARPAQERTGDRPAGDAARRRPAAQGTGQGAGTYRGEAGDRGRRPQGSRPAGTGTGTGAGRTSSGDRYAGSRPRTGQTRDGAGTGRGDGAGRTGFGRGDQRPQGTRTGDGRYQGSAPGRGTGSRPFGQGGGRGSAPGRGGDAKPMEKEGRMKNDRGARGDRRGAGRGDKGDKFDRMEQTRAGAKGAVHGKTKNRPAKPQEPVEEKIKSITIPETLTVKELADALKIQPSAIVKKLFMQGKMVTVNEEIDFATAEEIAIEYEVICEKEVKVDVIEELLRDTEDPEDSLVARPPVVCVMGHVDHGKTSLLDAIRDTHVIDREAGGITQHIGASVVEIGGRRITFLDTPGHEAFTAMRMRGANSTDIAILVVAADDGVMPQTVEAINHAKAAGIEIIVAINKIDKPAANVDKVKQELTEYQLIPEDWGGSTVFCEVSAKTHEGIDNLLEMILLTAEVLELKSNPNRRARGLVIEAQLDKGRGPVATVLIQKGTLHVGDPVCAGSCYGRVRAMLDDKRRPVKEAGPSTPVEIIGFSGVPGAGEIIISPETEKEARSFAETFISEGRERMLEETKQKMSLDDLFSQIQSGNLKELNLIVKADVQGSVEAVKQSLLKLSNEEVVVRIIHSGAGAINESDVILASASNAIIIGFNVKPDPQAKSTADQEGVDVRLYRVIYDAIADVEAAMKGMLDPVFEEKVIGHGEVRQTFRASGIGTIAGSYVLDGIFRRGCKARITREGQQIFDGEVASLKRFKDDVKEVKAGYECGLVFEKFNDVREGDQIEAYTMVEVPR